MIVRHRSVIRSLRVIPPRHGDQPAAVAPSTPGVAMTLGIGCVAGGGDELAQFRNGDRRAIEREARNLDGMHRTSSTGPRAAPMVAVPPAITIIAVAPAPAQPSRQAAGAYRPRSMAGG
jgi:hypothetical protein